MFKVNNRNTRYEKVIKSYEICSKLAMTGLALVSLLLTLNIFHTLF